MIDVRFRAQAKRDIYRIRKWLWQQLPSGNYEEYMASRKLVEAEILKIQSAADQISLHPKSGQEIKPGEMRKIVVSKLRYVMAYRMWKNGRHISVHTIRGAQRPIKALTEA